MKITELGEFGLIERVAGMAASHSDRVVVGIGDDAAAWRPQPGRLILATCDMMVEGIHFDLSYFPPRDLGWKALAINLSDVAAMGGLPRTALLSLGLRPDLTVQFVDGFYGGLLELGREFGVDLVGGDTVSSPRAMVVDVTVLGEVEEKYLTLRSGARPGDAVLVTGTMGDAAAGLALLRSGRRPVPGGQYEQLYRCHLNPYPRIREARAMVHAGGLTSLDDVSDGLAGEVAAVARAAGVGFRLWAGKIPLSGELRAAAAELGTDPLAWGLDGGEEFELFCTARPEAVPGLQRAVREATGTELTVIGEVVPRTEGNTVIDGAGKATPLARGGYDHFKRV